MALPSLWMIPTAKKFDPRRQIWRRIAYIFHEYPALFVIPLGIKFASNVIRSEGNWEIDMADSNHRDRFPCEQAEGGINRWLNVLEISEEVELRCPEPKTFTGLFKAHHTKTEVTRLTTWP